MSFMKSIVLGAAVAMALSAAPAIAACKTSAMAGTWRVATDAGICVATVSTSGGITGTCGTGSLALTSACKLTGKMGGRSFEGRTEAIATGSSLRPNLFLAWGSYFGGIAGYRR